jgi:2-haloacid dehalogenase
MSNDSFWLTGWARQDCPVGEGWIRFQPSEDGAMALAAIVFDVNETLLDLRSLDAPFEAAFGDRAARMDWFKQLLQLSLLANTLPAYSDFSALGRAALEMIAAQRDVALSPEQVQKILGTMRELAPHDDVLPSLERLRRAGFRLATLTNSAPDAIEAQLRHAAIRDQFEVALSIDAVQRFKPAPETYRMAAERLGVPIGEMMLVAAHGWDVWGAMNAGARAAFVARAGQVLIPLAPRPQIVGPTLLDVTDQILTQYAH